MMLQIGSALGVTRLDPFEILLRVLAAGWVGAHVEPELAAELERCITKAEAAGYAWFAGQAADALLRIRARVPKGAERSRLQRLAGAVPGVRLSGLLARPEAWSRALDALLAITSEKAEGPAQESAVANDRRLVWIIVERYGSLGLEPREQTRGKGGFSKGRPVALKRLYNDAATMGFLRDEDRAACRADRRDRLDAPILPRRQLRKLDSGKAFLSPH